MIRRSMLLAAVLVIVSGNLTPVLAANASSSSFSIAPPPIANPVFKAREGDMKVRGTYLTMEGTDPANPFDLKGYGVDFVGRTAFNDFLAIDGGIGVTYLDGDMGAGTGTTTTLSGVTVPITFNLEVQPVKNDVFNLILFAGPQFSISYMDMSGGFSATTDSYVYGIQGGVQAGFNINNTVGIDVFGMALTQSGTQDVYTSMGDYSYDIPSYTTTSFGLDLEYIPWGLTLSSMLQEAGKSDSNGMKTHMYQISWSHKF